MSDAFDKPFSRLLLGLQYLDRETILTLQIAVESMLQTIVVDAAHAPITLDMQYFKLFEDPDVQHEVVPAAVWMQKLQELDREKLVLVDAVITFVLNNKDFKKAFPVILKRLEHSQAKIQSAKITEFGFVTLSFPKPPEDASSS